MPVFSLRPLADLLEDPDWRTIPYRGECWVTAADEAEARGVISVRYAHARASAAPCPWLQRRLVAVELFEIAPVGAGRSDAVAANGGPEGGVTRQGSARWP